MTANWIIHRYDNLPSTQDEARSLLESNSSLPFVVIAKTQTAGRGRSGRPWMSISGNLLNTAVISSALSARHAGQYAFLVAIAMADALKAHGVNDIELKWPNDVLVRGRKIAGILLESDIGADGILAHLLIGTGVNIAHAPEGAVALYGASAQRPSVDEFLNTYLSSLTFYLDKFRAGGFADIRELWLSQAYGIGTMMRVRLPQSEFSGVFQGINEEGALIVEVAGEESPRIIYSGDVFFGKDQ